MEKKKILIADDSIELCNILQSIFKSQGYEVSTVNDGYALIDHLKENQDVDAVILDLVMPDNGGLSSFDTIKSISPASKIIIYTGYSRYEHSVIAREADAFINKTEKTDKIIQIVKDLLA